jgi:hypothetical protein
MQGPGTEIPQYAMWPWPGGPSPPGAAAPAGMNLFVIRTRADSNHSKRLRMDIRAYSRCFFRIRLSIVAMCACFTALDVAALRRSRTLAAMASQIVSTFSRKPVFGYVGMNQQLVRCACGATVALLAKIISQRQTQHVWTC